MPSFSRLSKVQLILFILVVIVIATQTNTAQQPSDGMITGRVLKDGGKPLAGINVRALRVRDSKGRHTRNITLERYRRTDDRGIYRIFGLEPGSYIVSAGGGGNGRSFTPTAYDSEAPTFYRSAKRNSA